MKRKLLIALLCAALLTGVLPAACPTSAKAEGSAPWGVEFAYNNKKYALTGGSSVLLSKILSAVGLSGTVSSVGGRVVNSKGEVDVFAIYDVLDFTYDSGKDDWMVTAIGVLDSSNSCTMYVTISGTEYTFALTWLDGTISGIPPANGGYVYVNGIRWRVIGVSSDKWLLISANVLGGKIYWDDSMAYCGTLYGNFSPLEQAVVLSTTKTEFDYKYEPTSVTFKAADLNGGKLFLPSVLEVVIYFSSDSDRTPGGWWLRSLRNYGIAGDVLDDGSVRDYSRDYKVFGVRPAFVLNLPSVLFESAAVGGKPAMDSGFGAYTTPATAVDRKLTLLDSARSGFTASAGSSSAIAGRAFAVNYSGAKTGTNEYVSAMLCDASGRALYYASLTPESSGSGTWDMVIPADLAAGSYTLKVFSEQRNGDYQTDYASAPVEIPLTVTPAYTVTVNNGTGGGNYAEGESVTITASAPETGKQFAGWTGADGLTFTSGSAATATATFTMPARAVEVMAVYEDIRYSIATDGAAQAYYHDSDFNQVFPAEATEGTELSLWVREDATPETGNYFTGEFTLDGESLLEYDENGENPRPATGFTMPAHAVTVGAVQAAQDTLALSFAPGETRALPMDAWMQLQYYETAEGEPPLLRYDAATGTEALDVNRDGKPDLQIAFDDAANCVNLTRLPACAAFGAFAFTFTGPTDHYGTITFTLPAPVFGAPDFTLPAALTTVEAEAFEGIAASVVDVPANCAAIGDRAFRSCPNLTQIRIPDNCALGTDVFEGCATVVVFGAAESSAEYYCESHDNCVFVPVE